MASKLQQLEASLARLKRERNEPHTMIEDLASFLYDLDNEIATLERKVKEARSDLR